MNFYNFEDISDSFSSSSSESDREIFPNWSQGKVSLDSTFDEVDENESNKKQEENKEDQIVNKIIKNFNKSEKEKKCLFYILYLLKNNSKYNKIYNEFSTIVSKCINNQEVHSESIFSNISPSDLSSSLNSSLDFSSDLNDFDSDKFYSSLQLLMAPLKIKKITKFIEKTSSKFNLYVYKHLIFINSKEYYILNKKIIFLITFNNLIINILKKLKLKQLEQSINIEKKIKYCEAIIKKNKNQIKLLLKTYLKFYFPSTFQHSLPSFSLPNYNLARSIGKLKHSSHLYYKTNPIESYFDGLQMTSVSPTTSSFTSFPTSLIPTSSVTLNSTQSILNFKPLLNYQFQYKVSGHLDGPAYNLVFDHKNEFLLTASDDFLIKCWNLATGTLLYTCRGHDAYITHLILSPDNYFFVSSCTHGIIRIWRLSDGKCLKVLHHELPLFYTNANINQDENRREEENDSRRRNRRRNQNNSVTNTPRVNNTLSYDNDNNIQENDDDNLYFSVNWLSFDYDTLSLLSVGDDGNLKVWDLSRLLPIEDINSSGLKLIIEKRFNLLEKFQEQTNINSITSNNLLFQQQYPPFLTGNGVFHWSYIKNNSFKYPSLSFIHKNENNSIQKVVSINLCSPLGIVATGSSDGVLRLWKYDDFKSADSETGLIAEFNQFSNEITDLKFNNDGSQLIAGSQYGGIFRIWNFRFNLNNNDSDKNCCNNTSRIDNANCKIFRNNELVDYFYHSVSLCEGDEKLHFLKNIDQIYLYNKEIILYHIFFVLDYSKIITVQSIPSLTPISNLNEKSLGHSDDNILGTTIKIWNSLTAELLSVIPCHHSQSPTRSFSCHPIYWNIIATGYEDGQIIIWDLEKFDSITTFKIFVDENSSNEDVNYRNTLELRNIIKNKSLLKNYYNNLIFALKKKFNSINSKQSFFKLLNELYVLNEDELLESYNHEDSIFDDNNLKINFDQNDFVKFHKLLIDNLLNFSNDFFSKDSSSENFLSNLLNQDDLHSNEVDLLFSNYFKSLDTQTQNLDENRDINFQSQIIEEELLQGQIHSSSPATTNQYNPNNTVSVLDLSFSSNGYYLAATDYLGRFSVYSLGSPSAITKHVRFEQYFTTDYKEFTNYYSYYNPSTSLYFMPNRNRTTNQIFNDQEQTRGNGNQQQTQVNLLTNDPPANLFSFSNSNSLPYIFNPNLGYRNEDIRGDMVHVETFEFQTQLPLSEAPTGSFCYNDLTLYENFPYSFTPLHQAIDNFNIQFKERLLEIESEIGQSLSSSMTIFKLYEIEKKIKLQIYLNSILVKNKIALLNKMKPTSKTLIEFKNILSNIDNIAKNYNNKVEIKYKNFLSFKNYNKSKLSTLVSLYTEKYKKFIPNKNSSLNTSDILPFNLMDQNLISEDFLDISSDTLERSQSIISTNTVPTQAPVPASASASASASTSSRYIYIDDLASSDNNSDDDSQDSDVVVTSDQSDLESDESIEDSEEEDFDFEERHERRGRKKSSNKQKLKRGRRKRRKSNIDDIDAEEIFGEEDDEDEEIPYDNSDSDNINYRRRGRKKKIIESDHDEDEDNTYKQSSSSSSRLPPSSNEPNLKKLTYNKNIAKDDTPLTDIQPALNANYEISRQWHYLTSTLHSDYHPQLGDKVIYLPHGHWNTLKFYEGSYNYTPSLIFNNFKNQMYQYFHNNQQISFQSPSISSTYCPPWYYYPYLLSFPFVECSVINIRDEFPSYNDIKSNFPSVRLITKLKVERIALTCDLSESSNFIFNFISVEEALSNYFTNETNCYHYNPSVYTNTSPSFTPYNQARHSQRINRNNLFSEYLQNLNFTFDVKLRQGDTPDFLVLSHLFHKAMSYQWNSPELVIRFLNTIPSINSSDFTSQKFDKNDIYPEEYEDNDQENVSFSYLVNEIDGYLTKVDLNNDTDESFSWPPSPWNCLTIEYEDESEGTSENVLTELFSPWEVIIKKDENNENENSTEYYFDPQYYVIDVESEDYEIINQLSKKEFLTELKKIIFEVDDFVTFFYYSVNSTIIPAYYNEIVLPIWLNLILLRLKNKYYRSYNQFFYDLIKILTNCQQFNSNNNEINQLCYNNLKRIINFIIKKFNLKPFYSSVYHHLLRNNLIDNSYIPEMYPISIGSSNLTEDLSPTITNEIADQPIAKKRKKSSSKVDDDHDEQESEEEIDEDEDEENSRSKRKSRKRKSSKKINHQTKRSSRRSSRGRKYINYDDDDDDDEEDDDSFGDDYDEDY